MINRNQWEQRGSAPPLHIVLHKQGCGHTLIQILLGMRWVTFLTCSRQNGCLLTVADECVFSDNLSFKNAASLLRTFLIERSLFWECIVKVIFFAVNLPSQITLLSLRISYVFSSLSPLNLSLSCPEPFVANRARRSEVFKVDVWVGNSANLNVAFLPSAFCSLQACAACQLSLVSAAHKADAHMLPASQPARRECVWSHGRDAHEVVRLQHNIIVLQELETDGASIKRFRGGRECRVRWYEQERALNVTH